MFRVNTTRRNVKRAPSPFRPATDVSGNFVLVAGGAPKPPTGPASAAAAVAPADSHTAAAIDKSISAFFDAESAATLLTKPWLRLERGLRLKKYRAFTETFPGLTGEERTALYDFLVRANDAKQLNTKSVIQYEGGVITAIKGLKIIRTGDPSVPAVFKIEMGRQTKRNTSPTSST